MSFCSRRDAVYAFLPKDFQGSRHQSKGIITYACGHQVLTEFIGLSNVLYEVIDTAMDTIVFSDFADRLGMIAVEHKEYALAQDDSCRITAIVAATRVVTDVNVRAKASRYVGGRRMRNWAEAALHPCGLLREYGLHDVFLERQSRV